MVETLKICKRLVDKAWKDQSLFKSSYVQTEELLRQLLIENPEDPRILTSLGAVLSDTGRHQEALNLMKTALTVGFEDRTLFENIGAAMMNLPDQRINAKKFLNRAVKFQRDPLTIKAYFDPHGH